MGLVVWRWWAVREDTKMSRQNEEKILRRARHRALRIVRDARDRAVEIISQAGELAGQQDKWLDEQVKKATEEKLAGYKEMLDKLYQDVKAQAESEMDEFESVLEKETVGGQQVVTTKIEAEYQEARKRVSEFEAEKMKQVEEAALRVMGEVLKKATGKVLSLEQHKDLIRGAVEEARREHIL